jgi:hypothetical protein
MSAREFLRVGLIAAAIAGFVPSALAQHVLFDAPSAVSPNRAPPPVQPLRATTAWPRLDPGAVLCRTEDDLDRHAANMTARVSGRTTQPADCQIIGQPTAIQILTRQGLGRTQVRMSPPGTATGWTDAWLPDRAPPAR